MCLDLELADTPSAMTQRIHAICTSCARARFHFARSPRIAEHAMSRLSARSLGLFASTLILGSIGSVAIAPEARAATLLVTTCIDGAIGSLRDVAAAANSGDVLDIRGLACNQMTLTRGPILISDEFITIVGAGESRIRIDGNRNGRVFTHSGTWPEGSNATLTLRNLTVQNGLVVGTNPGGGCINSLRNVRLEHVHLRRSEERRVGKECRSRWTAYH